MSDSSLDEESAFSSEEEHDEAQGESHEAEDLSPSNLDGPSSPRKRRRDTDGFSAAPRAKRLRGYYLDEYRQLFNTTVTEASCRFSIQTVESLEESLIGCSTWSSTEKNIFFCAVEKLGCDDLPGLAAAIGSKSLQEVRQLILLLRAGVMEVNHNFEPEGVIKFADIPAAVELSEPCCDALDVAAEALAWSQEKWEAKQEKQRHGAFSLLNYRTADVFEQEFAPKKSTQDPNTESHEQRGAHGSQSSEDEQRVDVGSAGSLLRLTFWLELSTRIFMNPAAPREADNWRNLADPGDTPGIYRSAFEDLYTLTLSITHRLVQASLFQAMSRVRASENLSNFRPRKDYVRRSDVQAAAKVLNMNLNSHEFWRTASRRCHLRVLDGEFSSRNGKIRGNELSYGEVEKLLGDDPSASALTENSPSHPSSAIKRGEHGISEEDQFSDEDSPSASLSDETDMEEEHHKYAEITDQKASNIEEHRLWQLLTEQDSSQPIEIQTGLPNSPTTMGKVASGTQNWRDWIAYESNWESAMKSSNSSVKDDEPSDQGFTGHHESSSKTMKSLPIGAYSRSVKSRSATVAEATEGITSDEAETEEMQLPPRRVRSRSAKAEASVRLGEMTSVRVDDDSDLSDYEPQI